MKIFFLFWFSGIIFHLQAQLIQNNKANIFTLKTAYCPTTPVFEGGNLAYFDCSNCTNDSLPFIKENHHFDPNFRVITFSLNESMDIFFSGTMLGMGDVGEISQSFSMENPFITQETHFPFPENPTLFEYDGQLISLQNMECARNAWLSIDNLIIVREALQNDFKLGIHLYTPSILPIDYGASKWIFFLYKNMNVNSLSEIQNENDIFPNPTSDFLHLKSSFKEGFNYQISSLDGKVIQQQNLISNTISVSNLVEGMYFLEIKENDKLISRLKFQKI